MASASPRVVRFRPISMRVAAVSVALAGLAAAVPVWPYLHWQSDVDEIPSVSVRRVLLDAVVSASGLVESSQSTEIRCNLERLEGAGSGGNSGGVSTIVSLIPDGSAVEKGDVLCELDASEYVELVRRQTITVQQARAAHRQAALDLQVAQIELESFQQGEARQNEQMYQSQIALMRSDLIRARDRWNWAQRMKEKGYASPLQVRTEQHTMQKAQVSLAQVEGAFGLYERFTVPKTSRVLQSDVESAEAAFSFQDSRLRQEEDRLRHYQKMAEECTVRAPHEGVAIYANRPDRTPRVYLGAPVRQRLRLFYLPDLSQMEVGAILHETVMERVQPGMLARVVLEALPDLVLEGRVTSISRLPLVDRKAETGTEVTYYLGRIALVKTPEGLRPGMSARVDILTAERPSALVVPVAAVSQQDGRELCYVVRPDHIEQRTVRLGQHSLNLMEVVEGLKEGERVIPNAMLVRGADRAEVPRARRALNAPPDDGARTSPGSNDAG